ncbi:general transcription factor 3C polypeptide 5 isoform X2 [Toxorhynchites rutilus septentrionalis]|uniref:general transcription factor 3C polypeptide 5 isoform X2 n=1 Tax=Toxorhynchites rutilus septentrionalis TaxID=329112 RepID=UPI00247A37C5|nr:general transcription factor 3C polypeptide 5 isoform X2 [Toxorhynchites rutilus septentrionalis]
MECDPMNSHKHNLCKELVCIEYPGIVRNPDRMIASLGGNIELSNTICSEKRRLELRLRPDSIYAKPVFGDRNNTTGIVFKLKIRRKRKQPNEVELLPAARNQMGRVECVYEKIVPSGVIVSHQIGDSGHVPFFMPPISFSRFDNAQLSIFKSKDITSDLFNPGERERARRTKHGIYHSFSLSDPLPAEPNALAIQTLRSRNVQERTISLITKSFHERPVWTKAALKSTLQLSEDDIRYVLPSVAYYFVNGPWRGTWTRFGYDPRKFFESRFYQLLDFRIRSIGDLHAKVNVKRTHKPTKPCMRFANPASNTRDPEKPSLNQSIAPKNNFIFTMDTLPQMRIIFYQYCDVQVPRIQQMLEKIPTPMTGAICNEKTGWLPPRFDEQCRDILTEIVLNNFRKKKESDPTAMELDETEEEETELTFDEEDDSGEESED